MAVIWRAPFYGERYRSTTISIPVNLETTSQRITILCLLATPVTIRLKRLAMTPRTRARRVGQLWLPNGAAPRQRPTAQSLNLLPSLPLAFRLRHDKLNFPLRHAAAVEKPDQLLLA